MDPAKEHIPRLERFLDEIDYRHPTPVPPCVEFLEKHHNWFQHVLAPRTSQWPAERLDAIEDFSTTFSELCIPFADVEMKFLMARITAIALYIDDSINNGNAYQDMGLEDFARRIYAGEAQDPDTVLSLFYETIKEICEVHEGDAILRSFAVTSWINYPNACLLEKRLLTFDEEVRASPYDMGYERILEGRKGLSPGVVVRPEATPDEAEVKFPLFLRNRNGVGDAYSAAIFKATRSQKLPLTRFVKALPDMTYYTEVVNDLLSFYKEQLVGETTNLISIQHKLWRDRQCGTGPASEWTLQDTFGLLCDETRDAILRVDKHLRMEVCERIEKGELKCADVGLEMEDVAIAKQWREYRNGYIAWHLESPRYKLDFMDISRYQ